MVDSTAVSKDAIPTIIQSKAVSEMPQSPVTAPTAVPRRIGRSRRTVTSRFKGFDDEFDTPKISEPSQIYSTQAPVSQFQKSEMFVSQDQSMDIDRQTPHENIASTRPSRKRTSPPLIEEENEEDILDQLAPAAANLKRRRREEHIARERRGESTPPPSIAGTTPNFARGKSKKQKKEPLDVLEVARQQREKEEENARVEREALQQAMGDMDIDEIRKLAIIEEMPVKRPQPSDMDNGDRWDERWNGRKNFKKFRRRGEAGIRTVNKVMVPLEEVKKKDFGIGDEYWLEGDKESQKRKKGKGRMRDSQAVSQIETQVASSRIGNSQVNETEEAAQDSDLEIVEAPTTAVTHKPSATPRTQTLSDKTDASRNQAKRAAEPMAKPAPAKKSRQAARKANIDSDDSDDGLRFKFRKKK